MRVEVLFVNEAGVMAETVEAPDGAAASEVLGLAGASLPAGAALVCDPKKVRRARAESQGDVRVVTCGRHGGRRRLAKTAQ